MDTAKDRCSLLPFVATPAEEDALRQAATEFGLPFEKLKDATAGEYHWMGLVGGETVIAIRPTREAGRVTMGPHARLGSAAKGIRFQSKTGAQGIVQLGMAFGADPQTQQLGDVIVSTAVVPYDNRDVRPATGPPGYTADYSQAAHEPAQDALVQLFRREAARGQPFGVHFGPVLSGAARIHCAAFRDELISRVPEGDFPIAGGEMEGIGLLAASQRPDAPIWCIVKGISDFADEARDKVIAGARPVACLNSARFVVSALVNAAKP